MKKIEVRCCGECPFLEHLASGRGDIVRCAHQGREIKQPLGEIAPFCKLADVKQEEQESGGIMHSPLSSPLSGIMSLQALFDQMDFINGVGDGSGNSVLGISNEEEADEFNPVYRGNIGNVATIEIILNNLPPNPPGGFRNTNRGTHRGDDSGLRKDESQEDF